MEIFRKTAGNLQESDFDSFVKILKRLSDFFYFNELEKSIDAKFVDLMIYMNLDDRIKVCLNNFCAKNKNFLQIKEKLSSFTDSNSNDLVAKQQKLKEMNLNVGSAMLNNGKQEESEEEEELKLEPMENKKTTKKSPLTPNMESSKTNNVNGEGHKKLNPLNSAKYKNVTPVANNRSKTKSPFRTSKTEFKTYDKSISGSTQKESKNGGNKPNLMPLFTNSPNDIMKKSEKNHLYEKIFQRAQQIDLEEKMKGDELKFELIPFFSIFFFIFKRFNKLQSMNENDNRKDKSPGLKTKT